jgi:hydroxyacylglutathione hydrolase
MIKVEKFVVNPLGENSFIISDETGECIFIDPGFYFVRRASGNKRLHQGK